MYSINKHSHFCALFIFFYCRNTNTDITFHFYGPKRDSIRIRSVMQKMVERGRLGKISWNPVFFDFKQEAALQIMVRLFSFGLRASRKPTVVALMYSAHKHINITENSYLWVAYCAIFFFSSLPFFTAFFSGSVGECQLQDGGAPRC